ncbi:hypothetical protein [Rhodohalobacter sp. 8-1]|uniref:hypothetical protein n=1 Tax=Rhodohalobacter sp. 8-1 TaxID=3131972 RepID=UPI0030EE0A56
MEKNKYTALGVFIMWGVFGFLVSCNDYTGVEINETLDVIPELSVIDGAHNSTVIVNKGDSRNSFFTLELSNIDFNNVITNGENEGWCIAWDKPINSNNGVYEEMPLLSTFGDKTFKPINYFLNIRSKMRTENPSMTYREEQVVIWMLRDFPEFDLEKLSIEELPGRLRSGDQPLFDIEIVQDVYNTVKEGVNTFEYTSEFTQVYAVVVENATEDQTVFTVAGGTMFAFGDDSEGSFECNTAIEITRWGWVFEYVLDGGPQKHDYLVGAGDETCSPYDSGGEKAGALTVTDNNDILTLNISNDGLPYLFNDPHFWVGCNRTDINDLAGQPPAHFPYPENFDETANFTDETFEIDISSYGCTGSIYISAHVGNN